MSATVLNDRTMVVEAVINGLVSEDCITDEEITQVEETVMDLILKQKSDDGKIVFYGVLNGTVN